MAATHVSSEGLPQPRAPGRAVVGTGVPASHGPAAGLELSDADFERLRRWLHAVAGIHLTQTKKAMVAGRLQKRARALGCGTLGEYLARLDEPTHREERQHTLDALTTNETYFFREPKHFELLAEEAAARIRRPPVRVWSAACSTGEEPYSIAAVLHDVLGERPWEVLATDLSGDVLDRARRGIFLDERTQAIPAHLRQRYFLTGTGPRQGQLLVSRALRRRVRFAQLNLNGALPPVGPFDIVFLRNVLIYFDAATKAAVAERIAQRMAPDGLLLIGHSETLTGLVRRLVCKRPSVYQLAGS